MASPDIERLTNRPASYALHIRPLFTKKQIDCMAYMFQLDVYDDVKANAESIYARLADHSMPMDETRPWPHQARCANRATGAFPRLGGGRKPNRSG